MSEYGSYEYTTEAEDILMVRHILAFLGYQAILREILGVIIVVAEDGSSGETLADMLNRINEDELSSREEHFAKAV